MVVIVRSDTFRDSRTEVKSSTSDTDRAACSPKLAAVSTWTLDLLLGLSDVEYLVTRGLDNPRSSVYEGSSKCASTTANRLRSAMIKGTTWTVSSTVSVVVVVVTLVVVVLIVLMILRGFDEASMEVK